MLSTWHWEITKECNLQCKHCLIASEGAISDPSDDFSVIERIVALGGERLLVTGGEPFIVPNFYRKMEEARRNNLQLSVITNGTLLDKFNCEVAAELFDVIGISIDGTKTTHDSIRGIGAYEKTISTISFLKKFKKTIVVYLTLMSVNFNELRETVTNMIELGVKTFHFNQINLMGRSLGSKHLGLALDTEQLLNGFATQLNEIIDLSQLHCSSKKCDVDANTVYLNCHGEMYSCVELSFLKPELSIAHIHDTLVTEKVGQYFAKESPLPTCRYSTYSCPGVTLNLNTGKCPYT